MTTKTIEHNKHLAKFGNRIRQLRMEQGLSQEQLGFLSGLDRTYIGGIERGERNITILKIVKLAEALKVIPSDLLG